MDVKKRIVSMRLTHDEKEQAFYYLMDEVQPREAVTESAAVVSLADIWDAGEPAGMRGLSTGYPSIDLQTQGMAPGQVHVYFGDTGHGKSQVVQNIAVQVAEKGIPVLFIGLEMTKEENRERFRDFGAKADTPIYQPASIDLDYKAIEASILSDSYGLVIIDHLHMFENTGHDGEPQFLSAVCKEVKMLAIKHNIPVILVSHINEDKNRTGVPKLSDLKGSSSIKQIADVAIAIYNDGMVNDLPGPAEMLLTLRKNRRGRKHINARLRILENARLVEKPVFN